MEAVGQSGDPDLCSVDRASVKVAIGFFTVTGY